MVNKKFYIEKLQKLEAEKSAKLKTLESLFERMELQYTAQHQSYVVRDLVALYESFQSLEITNSTIITILKGE